MKERSFFRAKFLLFSVFFIQDAGDDDDDYSEIRNSTEQRRIFLKEENCFKVLKIENEIFTPSSKSLLNE
jgi:hypothetical protein